MSKYFVHFGFLCEFNTKTAKFFDCKEQKLVELPNSFKNSEDVKLELGKFYLIRDKNLKQISADKIIYTWVQAVPFNGKEVIFNTVATCPMKSRHSDGTLLTEEIYKKYKGKVWSPYFGFLNDPKGILRNPSPDFEVLWVKIRYAPKDDTIFELIFEDCLAGLDLMPTPWSIENGGPNGIPKPQIHPSLLIVPQKKFSKNTPVENAICVQVDVPNAAYNLKHKGSTQRCAHFFSMRSGMYRCVQPVTLGTWYNHKVMIKRNVTAVRNLSIDECAYLDVTARGLEETDAQIPTKIVNGIVQFEVEFPFEHEAFEDKENSKFPPWMRFEGLRKNAHFCDEYLGKVEIDPTMAINIITKIESNANPKSNPITVKVTVTLHPNCDYNRGFYPERGLFLVTELLDIKDSDGNVI